MKPLLIYVYMISFLLLVGCGSAYAKENFEEKAAEYYKQKHYAEALDIWYGMVESGVINANLYYNIGITESLLNHTPEAILAYEQAKRIKPGSTEFKAALNDERKKIENATIPVKPFFLQEWIRWFVSLLRPGVWSITGLVVVFIAVVNILLGLKVIDRRPIFSQRTGWLMCMTGIIFIFIGYLSYFQMYRDDETIIAMRCEFRQAPSDESPQIRILYPGEKATIHDQIGEWYHVQLLNLDAGWIKKGCAQLIRMGKTKRSNAAK